MAHAPGDGLDGQAFWAATWARASSTTGSQSTASPSTSQPFIRRPSIGSKGLPAPASTISVSRAGGSFTTSWSCHQTAKNFVPVRSELVYLLVLLDKDVTRQQPSQSWEHYYASRLAAHFR